MSRGKYRRRSRLRDEHAHAAAVAALQAALSEEDRRLHTAQHRVDLAAAAHARLDRETDLARRRLEPAESEARHVAARVVEPWQQLRAALVELRRVDDRLTSATGSGSPRHAAVTRAHQAGAAGLRITTPDVHRGAPQGYRRHWYRTTLAAGEPEVSLPLQGWVPDGIATDRDTLARFALSTTHATTAEAGWCWAVPPWLRQPDGTDAPRLRAALGATTSGAPAPLDRPHSQPYSGPPLPADATVTLPWRNRPLLDHPTDAADLAHWYQRSAWAQLDSTPPAPRHTHQPGPGRRGEEGPGGAGRSHDGSGGSSCGGAVLDPRRLLRRLSHSPTPARRHPAAAAVPGRVRLLRPTLDHPRPPRPRHRTGVALRRNPARPRTRPPPHRPRAARRPPAAAGHDHRPLPTSQPRCRSPPTSAPRSTASSLPRTLTAPHGTSSPGA